LPVRSLWLKKFKSIFIEAEADAAAWRPPPGPEPGCVPLSRTHLRPGAGCPTGQDTRPTFPTVSEAGQPACNSTRDPQTRTEPPSQARQSGQKRRAPFRLCGQGTSTRKGPAMDPTSRNLGQTDLVRRRPPLALLLLALLTPRSRRPGNWSRSRLARASVLESAAPRGRPGPCTPKRAEQPGVLHRPALCLTAGASGGVSGPEGRRQPGQEGSIPGVLPARPRFVKLPSRPGAGGLPDSLLRATS